MVSSLRQAKRPVTVLAGPYGHPVHPLLVALPIGAWVTSLIFDVASHVVHQSGFLAQGSEWLIAVGVVGAVLAACAGFLDLMTLTLETRAFRTAVLHMSLVLTATIGYVAGFAWRHASYHHPAPVPAGQLGLSVLSLAVLTAGGYLGGKLAYRYGVRVADEETQVEGHLPVTARQAETAAVPGHRRQA
jgi:uncharacterized membrane protein